MERTIYALVNEGARLLEEGIALRAVDIDIIYLNGYGFPAYRGGPMFYADTVGLRNVYERVREFEREHGKLWTPVTPFEKVGGRRRNVHGVPASIRRLTLSSAGDIRDALDLALADVPLPQECVLLDYPAYPNIGDHVIWLGEVLYLTTVRRVKIRFAGSLDEPLSLPGGVPILLSGGGNLATCGPRTKIFANALSTSIATGRS